jgi:hypothetical protein
MQPIPQRKPREIKLEGIEQSFFVRSLTLGEEDEHRKREDNEVAMRELLIRVVVNADGSPFWDTIEELLEWPSDILVEIIEAIAKKKNSPGKTDSN